METLIAAKVTKFGHTCVIVTDCGGQKVKGQGLKVDGNGVGCTSWCVSVLLLLLLKVSCSWPS